jgi:hypothetical protein
MEITIKKLSVRGRENNNNWRGDKVGYNGIHTWLRTNFGYPPFCEFCHTVGCRKTREWNIQWALKKGCKYERKRENFIGLCKICHRRYDNTLLWRKNISKGRTGIKVKRTKKKA